VIALLRQYERRVLPFLFTEALFHDTCLQLRSPVRITALCGEKMASRSVCVIVAVGGRYAETKTSFLLF
jgi:hypothetical protein